MSGMEKAVRRLGPWIQRLELFLIAAYCLCIISGLAASGLCRHAGFVDVFLLGFGVYFLFKGSGLLAYARKKCSSGCLHPLSTPASLCGFTTLALVCLFARPGMGEFVLISALCAAGGPAALLAYGVCVANPVRLSQIYARMCASDKK